MEKLVFSNDYVTSVGTHLRGEEHYIQVGVSEGQYIPYIQILLTDGKWEGYPVEVIVHPLSEPHSN